MRSNNAVLLADDGSVKGRRILRWVILQTGDNDSVVAGNDPKVGYRVWFEQRIVGELQVKYKGPAD
jgi:hypothetical protein